MTTAFDDETSLRNSPLNKKMKSRKRAIQGGAMLLLLGMVVLFISVAALAIEVGHILLIRNELQNAADAAALEGASYLYPSEAGTGNPNWSLAQTNGQAGISRNKVDKVTLSDGTVTTGYWDVTTPAGSMKSTDITPTINDVPAVQVTISKAAGSNGGPVNLFFGSFIGLNSVNVSATAVAITGSPSSVSANTLFPVAMAQGLYNTYWDSANNQPLLDPSTGEPYTFHISQGPDGGWSTFTTPSNSVPDILSYINNGNPMALSIGTDVWMSTGVKTSIYSDVPANVDILVAVAAESTPGTYQPIVAFAPLHIDFALGGSNKYIQVHFINNYKFTEGTIGGAYYGAYMPPRLAK